MKAIRKLATVTLSMMMAVSVLAGCGGSSGGSTGGGSAKEGASDSAAADGTGDSSGGALIIGTNQTATTLDPTKDYDGWYSIRFGFCETLTKINNDFSISGWLAEDDYSANKDNTEWTFNIKDGVNFSNGNTLTAEAVKNSLEYLFKNGERGPEFFTPDKITADGKKLVIKTKEPEPILPNKLADPLFSIIDTTADTSKMAETGPIGTGPFVYKSWDPNTREMVVSKNDKYWGGDVKTDEVKFIYSEDPATTTMGLQSGEFDAVYNISMADIETFEADSSSYTISQTASGRTAHGFMNQKGVLKDEVLRQAIERSIDKKTICENQLHNQYVAGKTLITSAADYGYDELKDINEYDPEGAKKLLDDAGYKDTDKDGFRETPDGKKIDLRFVYYTGRPEQEVIVQASQAELEKIGIKVTPEVREADKTMEMLQNADFDLLCMSINVLNCGDPENHFKSYFITGSSQADYGFSDKEFDSKIDELSKEADPKKRVELVKEAEQILMDKSVCNYFCYPLMNFVMKSNVSGIESTPADFYWVNKDTVKS